MDLLGPTTRGWNNSHNLINEVRGGTKTLRWASPAALWLVFVLYFLCNIAYCESKGLSALHSRPLSDSILLLLTSAVAAVPLEKIRTGGTLVAALFFKEVFGEYAGARILPIFVALSAFGNLMCVAFTADEGLLRSTNC